MEDLEKEAIRRGSILRALNYELNGMSDQSLGTYLIGQGFDVSIRDVRADLEYMAGKGNEYIEYKEKFLKGPWIVKLTPRGKRLLDGRAKEEDPEIKIMR